MIFQITTPGLSIYSYLVIEPSAKKAIVIDAPRNPSEVMRVMAEMGADLTAIFETHVHADFLSGSQELKKRLKGAPPIIASGLGGQKWTAQYADQIVDKDRLTFLFGSWRLEAWHTPGHTPEHIMWVLYEKQLKPTAVFTGDFLLAGAIGRPDLLDPGSTHHACEEQYHSIFKVLPMLPGDINFYPAHGAGSLCAKNIASHSKKTIDEERLSNSFLIPRPFEEWKELLLKELPQAPDYFKIMKQLNIRGAPMLELTAPKELMPEELGIMPELFLLDIRAKEEFAERHLKGAVNIPSGPSFINWACRIVMRDKAIALIASGKADLQNAINQLQLVGLDQIFFYFIWSKEIEKKLPSLNSFPLVSPHIAFSKAQEMLFVDVRTEAEWKGGHIPGAIHRELPNVQSLPQNKTLALICGSGYRSAIAASLLQKEGISNLVNVQGGMREWLAAGLPYIKE